MIKTLTSYHEMGTGDYLAACDGCGHEETFNEFEFYEVVTLLKEKGWKVKRVAGDWDNYCPDCVEKENLT